MENLVLVTKRGAFEQLEHEAAHCGGVESTPIAVLIHVLLEVLFAILKDKDELCFCVDHVVESDDVDVLQFFHEGDLANSSGGRALFSVQMDLFESNNLIGGPRSALGRILESKKASWSRKRPP
jgi:hypothetical protein